NLNQYLLQNLETEKQLNKIKLAENNGCVVLTIDSSFGNGKTLFLKEFKECYQQKKWYNAIIYLDTWQQDYLNNPILSIVRQIMQEEVFSETEKLKNLKSGTLKLVKSIATIADPTKTASEFLADLFPPKEEIAELKEALNKITENKKILFLIDELDRCRPNYAIDFLETIKHLFNQENTAFVIATNLSQLESSAKALFGNELDFANYYRKFSPTIWQLPRTKTTVKAQYIAIFDAFCEAFQLPEAIKSQTRKNFIDIIQGYLDEAKTEDALSLRSIKSVCHYFFDVVKNLEIQKLEKDKIDQAYSECDYQISIQKKIAYIAADALIKDILSSVLTVILYKILTPEYVILSKTGYEKNRIFSSKAGNAENTIKAMHIIVKKCNSQSFVLCAKPDSSPNSSNHSSNYNYTISDWKVRDSGGFSAHTEDYEIKQSAIYEALKSLIESGFSFEASNTTF
ncbi:MAG: hypothetical protein EBT55_06220, partial [Proteobacteria bacterium]|nr:hypothetical protein [Pseudomonadota bacterium]